MNKKPLGKPVKVELNRNCLLCSRYIGCRDPNKDMYYACSRFTTEFKGNLFDILEEDEEEEKRAIKAVKKYNRYNSDLNITDKIIEEDTIEDLINQVLDSGSPVPPDIRVNDRDIPKARNIVEWMTSPKFIGGEQKPFAKQIQVAGHALAEWCPNCSDEDYFEDVPVADVLDDILDRVVFLENGKCPKCKQTKSDLVEDEILIDPFEIIGIVGQRGSKSTTSNQIESYMLSKWLTTPNLPATYKVLPSSVFTATYTATTFGQAKGSFWDPLNAILMEAEWFRTYHKLLTETGRKAGEELYKHSETIIAYRHKNIFCSPASPSQRSLRGKTRISCFPKGTKVKTENGVMDISNPNIVGKRAEFLGKTGVITNHFDNGTRDLVIAKTSLGTKIKATPDHKFVVFDTITERFTKRELQKIKKSDKLVISLGHTFPKISPKLPELNDANYVGKSTDTTYENTFRKMYNLQKFDFRDFPEISQNLFYVYTSALRRKGVLKLTPTGVRGKKGVPNTRMELLNINSYEELREHILTSKRKNSDYRKWSDELRKTKLPTHMSVELAWILGSLVSDGKYCYETEIEYAVTDYNRIEKFIRCFKFCFGVEPRVNGPYQPKEDNKLPYWCIRFGTKYLKDFFRALGLKKGSWAGIKTIPEIMWTATKEECLSFLGGLWDGDGCGVTSYSSSSKHLLNGIQQMLFMLEVVSKVKTPKLYKDGDFKFHRELGSVTLRSAYDRNKFYKLINTYSMKVKSKKSTISINRNIRRGYNTKHTYAYPIKTVKDTRLRGGSTREVIWLDSKLNKHWSKYKNEYALNCLRLQDEGHAEYLSSWIDRGIVLCDLVSIKKTRPQKVYDITVDDKNHVYTIAGGYLVSNCIVDEAGWFKVGQKKTGGDFERMNGNEVYTALKRSLATMKAAYVKRLASGYSNLPKPMMTLISSPSARNDLIMTRYRKAQGSRETYSFKYCLSGDTLIRTKERGLVRIRDLAEHKNKPISKKITNLTTIGISKESPVVGWHYTGKKPTYELKLERGYSLRATATHKIKTLNNLGELEWKKLKDLKEGDYVVTNQRALTRKDKLLLNLTSELEIWEAHKNKITQNGNRFKSSTYKSIKRPKYMTPELAWIMGFILSEENISLDYKVHRITSANMNKKLIDKLVHCYKKVFNYTPKLYVRPNGLYIAIQMSHVLGVWFEQLGITNKLAYDKTIPDSILQADYKSQLAFIAAYVEGDGNVSKKNGLSICSSSEELIKQFQMLFESLGVKSTSYVTREHNENRYYPEYHVKATHLDDSIKLIELIKDYLITKYKVIRPNIKSYNSGLPSKWIKDFIKPFKAAGRASDDSWCKGYKNHLGKFKPFKGVGIHSYNNWKYDKYKAGYYNETLNVIKWISKEKYNNIRKLMNLKYEYVKVKSVSYYGIEDTYDLSMPDEAEHAYVANGVVVSNSTWQFNPNLPRSTFNEEFRTSPIEAARDYGCEPPMAASPWLSDEGLIESSFTSLINGIEVTVKRIKTKSKKLATAAHYKTLKKSGSNYGGVMGIDAGAVNNSFAFAIGYPTHIPDPTDEDEDDVLTGVDIHIVGEIIPRKDYPISFTRVYKEVLQPLCDEFNVAVVISDRWQNKKIVQDLEEALGISYYEISLNMENFNDYREGLYSGIIKHPRLEMSMKDIQETTLENYPECFLRKPVSHLCYQMMTVQSTGTTVTKGDEGATDDILRSCVIIHAALQDEDILEEVLAFTSVEERPSVTIGVMAGGTGASRGTNVTINNVAVGVSKSSGGFGGSSSSVGVVGRRR